MRCQHCSRDATVHLAESVNGQRRELHFCGSCARRAGLAPDGPPSNHALEEIVNHLISAHVGELVGQLAEATCPVCGLKFMEFRTRGWLGCPHDYESFLRGLSPLLRQAHGATRHVGKVPRYHRRRPSRLKLRARLRDAIDREDYEMAALLRDQLRQKDADV